MGNEPDLAELSYNAPDLTGNELLQFSKLAEGNLKRGKQPTATQTKRNPITGKVEQEFADIYNPTQIKEIADNFGSLVQTNKRLYKHYNNMLHSNDLGHLQELENNYKKFYTGDMDTPEKVAKAEKIALSNIPSNVRWEAVPDLELAQKRKQANIRLNSYLQSTGGGNVKISNIYETDFNDVSAGEEKPLSDLNATSKKFVFDDATRGLPERVRARKSENNYVVRKESDGNITIIDKTTGEARTHYTPDLYNEKYNTTVKEKQEIRRKEQTPTGNKKKVYNPKTGKFE